jgi:cysteine synthase A
MDSSLRCCVTRRSTDVEVASTAAMVLARRLHRESGLLVGMSSGANVGAALKAVAELDRKQPLVTLTCDRAERYLSTALFDLLGSERIADP